MRKESDFMCFCSFDCLSCCKSFFLFFLPPHSVVVYSTHSVSQSKRTTTKKRTFTHIIITTTSMKEVKRNSKNKQVLFMSIFIAMVFVSSMVFAMVKGDYPCDTDEHIPLCEPCVSSCVELLNYPKQSCPKVCNKVTECFCKPGLLRTSTGLCVPHFQCIEYEG